MATRPSLDKVRSRLAYDPETGWFTRRHSVRGYKAGSICGSVTANGYIEIVVCGYKTFAHRLAIFYVTGEWPPNDVDHINGDRSDNRFENLRLATRAQNMWNVGNTKGAYWHQNKWRVQIKANGKIHHFGSYDDFEEARAVYILEKKRLHGEYARSA